MSRAAQGTLLGAGIVTTIVALLAAADAGSSSNCSAEFQKWVGCILGAHEGLAGGLIGAAGAIFAGWLAWTGVRDQVQAERDLSTAKERGSLKAILIEMNDLFDSLNEIWRVIDLALQPEQPAEQRRHRIALANSLFMVLPGPEQLATLKNFTDAIATALEPTKRGQFIRMWQAIDWIYRAREDKENVPENDDGRYRLSIVRIHLSHLERYLSVFDHQTANKFDARTKADVDHRGIAAQIMALVDDAAAGKPLIQSRNVGGS